MQSEKFRNDCHTWALEAFGSVVVGDVPERCARFLEEALELCQSLDMPVEDAHALVDYVYGRTKGELVQEVGGVMVTLAVLCGSRQVPMQSAGDAELERIRQPDIVERVRKKQLTKPRNSPLPGGAYEPEN